MTDAQTPERIGFIGLGIMGRPMVRNLRAAGIPLVVHSRTQATVDALLAEEGASEIISVDSPAAVAARTRIIITMLPDSPDVEAVVFGENGLAAAMQSGSLLIDMSTIAPAVAQAVQTALAANGSSALDAPVSGGERGAIDGVLSIMVGGAEADVARAMPLFEVMGRTIVHVGDSGAGQTVKACNQIVVALHYAALSEALILGSRAGVDPAKVVQVLNGGLAASRVMELKGQSMVEHQFAPGFRIDLHRKDLAIANATSRDLHVPLPLLGVVTQLFESLAAAGRGQLDHSAVLTVYEDLAKHEVGSTPSRDVEQSW